jgi:hypothetical protein
MESNLPYSTDDFYFIFYNLFTEMNRSGLLDAEESEFLEAVRNFIRVEGRNIVVDAMLSNVDEEQIEIGGNMGCNSPPDDYDSDTSAGDSDEIGSLGSDSDDDSIVNLPVLIVDRIRLHGRIHHGYFHCSPFIDITQTFTGIPCGICDCEDFDFATCFQENNFEFLRNCFYKVNFDEQLQLATDSVNNERRLPNNDLRKFLYGKFFVALDFGALEAGERKKLPNCAVAKIRQIYPDDTGTYMGFKES